MALDPLDFLYLTDEELHPDLRKPVEFLFRFIGERWSVTGETPPQDNAHTGIWPLDYDRYPCMADRIDAIRENILLLAPHFVNLDPAANQPTGWSAVPLFYSAAAIAEDPELRPVLVTPARGTPYGRDEDAPARYIDVVKAAAKCLSRFRYVCAAPWTHVPSVAKLDLRGERAAPGTENVSAIASEYFDINGETVAEATWDSGAREWTRMATLDDLLASADAKTVVLDGTYQPRRWGISGNGIIMSVLAMADCIAERVGTNDDGTPVVTHSEGVAFNISGIPENVVVANPSGYFAECLLVYGPAPAYDTHGNLIPSHRKQTTYRQDGELQDIVERTEFRGQFFETLTRHYDESSSVETKRQVSYSDDGTRSRVVFDGTVTPGHRLMAIGNNYKGVERENYFDTFGVCPVIAGATAPAADSPAGISGLPAKDAGPVAGHEAIVAFEGYDHARRLLVQPDLGPQAILAEARNLYGAIGIPKYNGISELTDASAEAQCHLVPILDFGPAFKIDEDEELEDWIGRRPEEPEENQ